MKKFLIVLFVLGLGAISAQAAEPQVRIVKADGTEMASNDPIAQSIIKFERDEARVLSAELYQRLRNIASNDNNDIVFDNGVGVKGGGPAYVSVWVQLGGIQGADWDLLPDGQSHWLRTSISVDGALTGGKDPVVVARAQTSLWQVSAGVETSIGTGAALIRLGTVKVATKVNAEGVLGRLDAEVLGISWVYGHEVNRWLTLYTQQSLSVGMRVLEANAGTFRAVLGSDTRFGMLIGNRFYIAAHATWETDNGANSHAAYGLDTGFRLSKMLTLRGAVDYNRTFGDAPYDPMYIIPAGWSFNLGLFAKL